MRFRVWIACSTTDGVLNAEKGAIRRSVYRRLWDARPHAFLALFPLATVSTLLLSNPGEGVRVANLALPAAVALFVAMLAWILVGPLARSRLERSLEAVILTGGVLLSGYLFAWLREADLELRWRAGAELLLLAAVVLAGIVLVRRVRWPAETARFLNLFALLTVILALPSVIRSASAPAPTLGPDTILPDTAGLPRPDVYLIILDGYSDSETLRRTYGFDNGRILDSLRARGFVIPRGSRSNYTKTFLSIGSMLNRTYFEELSGTKRGAARDRDPYHVRMEISRTAIDLKRLGYRFYYTGSSYPPLSTNRLADEQYSDAPSRDFERLYLRLTAFKPVRELCVLVGPCSRVPFAAETARETLGRIRYLSALTDRPGPKFVYAHWLLPHEPYRLDAGCAAIPPRWTASGDLDAMDSAAVRLYLAQVRCTNQQLLDVIDKVRTESPNTVIILQSDHGHGRFPAGVPSDLAETDREQVLERFGVFAAYAGPAGVGDSLAAQRTPVNAFRTLFRVLWGVAEPPLEDRYFWSERSGRMNLREVDLDSLTERHVDTGK